MLRFKTVLVMLIALLFAASVACAADPVIGACTQSVTTFKTANPNLKVWTLDCTANDTDATFPAIAMSSTVRGEIVGWYVSEVRTYPDAVAAPQDAYDITITDADGFDIMGATLANRSDSTDQRALPLWTTGLYADAPIYGALNVNISGNNVNSAKMVIKVFVRK